VTHRGQAGAQWRAHAARSPDRRVLPAARERNVPEIHSMYEVSFPKLSDRYFKTGSWPPAQAIADLVDQDHVFCLLYKVPAAGRACMRSAALQPACWWACAVRHDMRLPDAARYRGLRCLGQTGHQGKHAPPGALLQELYFRHLYARAAPTLRERVESWENYMDLFGVILHNNVNMQVSALEVRGRGGLSACA